MPINDPHDRYVRNVLQIRQVIEQFLVWFLPKVILQHLDITEIKQADNTFVDKSLSKSISDLIYDCSDKSHITNSKAKHSRIIIFIEHQSTAQKLLVARVYHYMFAMLDQIMKSRDKQSQNKPKAIIHPSLTNLGDCNKTQTFRKGLPNPP